jgi:hypothetical protein
VAGFNQTTVNKYQFPDKDSTQEAIGTDIHPTALGAKAIAYSDYVNILYFLN